MKQKTEDVSYHFRPYVKNDASDSADPDKAFDQTLLCISQTKWQRELMQKYGNQLSMIDATYKLHIMTSLFLSSVCVPMSITLWLHNL